MRRTRSDCCARAESGHLAAAPPINVMNSRRLMFWSGGQSEHTATSLRFCHASDTGLARLNARVSPLTYRDALRDNAFEIHQARMPEDRGTVSRDRLAELDAVAHRLVLAGRKLPQPLSAFVVGAGSTERHLGIYAPRPSDGHSRQTDSAAIAMAERLCRTIDRLDSLRVRRATSASYGVGEGRDRTWLASGGWRMAPLSPRFRGPTSFCGRQRGIEQ
jgi:hypothetical protein